MTLIKAAQLRESTRVPQYAVRKPRKPLGHMVVLVGIQTPWAPGTTKMDNVASTDPTLKPIAPDRTLWEIMSSRYEVDAEVVLRSRCSLTKSWCLL